MTFNPSHILSAPNASARTVPGCLADPHALSLMDHSEPSVARSSHFYTTVCTLIYTRGPYGCMILLNKYARPSRSRRIRLHGRR